MMARGRKRKVNPVKEQQPKRKKTIVRFVSADRIAERQRQGWRKITPKTDIDMKMASKGDLVLMEKDV